ncbi:hypothetical protein CXF72_01900 [Psychromonas sp. MB-3u-54]|uniref:DUF58 domain-containing protein n=1 Tax=Psychromonas sp. MB-3u-54 TaxID=2058319 RepID=UPI000C33B750|nr:DUF58 domain-containing protein [Psychromonas sp. MB-3u-54]PKH04249.1 hypothetical protein CXF72_01900 [Psychromonas sp. MB-3u-54]
MKKVFNPSDPFKRLIKQRFERWLTARLPANNSFTLNQKNIFIFPSKFGLQFLILGFILFLLGTNYQNNLILFVVFFLISFMVTCLLLSYQNIADLTLTANPITAQFAGQDSVFCLRITKKFDRGQKIDFYFQQPSSALKSVIKDQQVFVYGLSKTRGWFKPGRVTLRSTFPFGLFTVWTHLDFGLSVLLYPEPLNNGMPLVSASAEQTNKGLTNFSPGFEQFSMLKSYQPGESLKSVAWKQLAQGRGWFSKHFEQAQGGNVLLDLALYKNLDLEKKLSLLCFQIIELDRNDCRYALKLGNKTIAAGHGLEHKDMCLKALALYL